MSILDKLKGLLNKIRKRNDENIFDILGLPDTNQEEKGSEGNGEPEVYVPIEFPENELVSFQLKDGVLDTNSRASEEILKHNLEVLVNQAKEAGKIDKFMLIREDDFFPHGWEWNVLSKNTNLEKEQTKLSYKLREQYALREAKHDGYSGMDSGQTYESKARVDKNIGSIMLPSRFRSTKHFTVNTPLEVTGDYNMVSTDRDYIIIDNMNGFLNSGYGYSVAYHDAYLDVSHEGLPISEEAVVLINDKNYNRIIEDSNVAEELAQRKVVRYKGETYLAVNMILSEMGALPSRIGFKYANYDKEIKDILDKSMRDLASENGLFFNKSHAGKEEHFSNYYDDKNTDYQNEKREYIKY
jgi:hypothetical protein